MGAATPSEIVLQQFNRHQNTVQCHAGRCPRRARSRTILTEHDDAWVDLQDKLHWIDDDKEFLWLSERDGWRHVYRVGRGGGKPALITPGDFDVIELLAVDEKSSWVYFIASPDNPTQRYLYRVHLDGTGRERVTPAAEPGTHDYEISPDAQLGDPRVFGL